MNLDDITTLSGKYVCSTFRQQLGTQAEGKMIEAVVQIENEMRERIARQIEAIDLGSSSQINGLGMRILAARAARGN